MKMPKFIKLIISFVILNLLFIPKIQATTIDSSELQWTDFSKATVYLDKVDLLEDDNLEDEDENEYENKNTKRYCLKIDNVSYATDNKTVYFIFLSNSDEKPDFGSTYTDMKYNAASYWKSYSEKLVDYDIVDSFIDRVGDIHVWVVEAKLAKEYEDSNIDSDDFYEEEEEDIECEFKEVLSNVVVSKPPLSSLGERVSVLFLKKYSATFTKIVINEPTDIYSGRNVSIEMGKVTDYNLLYKIKNNEPNNLDNLIDYTKDARPIYKRIINSSEDLDILSEVELEDDAYYYTYVKLLDENGTYRPIEDISLYRSFDVEETKPTDYITREDPRLLNYKSPNYTWKLPSLPIQPTPDQDPGTNPGQNPNPSPDQDPSTNPGQNPNPSPDQDPSTNPGQDPNPSPDQSLQPDSNSDSQYGSGNSSNNQSNDELDNTVIQGALPQTGEMPSPLCLIILVAIVGIVSYTCYIKYKDKI